MRTTVDIDDAILAAAKRRAAERGRTLTAFIEEALTAALLDKPRDSSAFRLRWKPHSGRLRPGVDLSDRDALLDAMEGRR
jgi:Arc/MetJ family transcription regulator